MNTLRTFILILASISFCIVIGGAVYEHLAIVPVWSSAVPTSLSMFQGEYGVAAARFWRSVHPVAMLLLLLGLGLNWPTRRRGPIIITLVGYLTILIVTSLYFVPELFALTGTAFSTTVDAELTRRAKTWEMLSIVRLALMLILAVILLFGLSRSGDADPLRPANDS